MSGKSCVYWIHLPEQTDIFTQGYVGVASDGAAKRFREHRSSAKNGSRLPVHNAIRKYGTRLVVETVVVGPVLYCYEVEGKLRSLPNTGYNVAVGGNVPPMLGRTHSKEARQKISEAGKGRPCNQEAKERLSKAFLGRHHTEETKSVLRDKAKQRVIPKSTRNAAAEANRKRLGWLNQFAVKSVWVIADSLYTYMLMNPSHGIRKIGKAFDIPYSQLQVLYRDIKDGWVPSESQDWLDFKKLYEQEPQQVEFA